MNKYICILATAALLAACEQKTETAAPAPEASPVESASPEMSMTPETSPTPAP